MRGVFRMCTIASVVLAAGCAKEEEQQQKPNAEPETHAHAAEGDGRALLPIMQELGARMAALTHGLMVDSAEMVAHNAQLMAEHAPIAPEEIARLQRTLGAEMAEFERIDADVHGRLVRLREAANTDSADVLSKLNEVQRGCLECHSRFRSRLRTGGAAAPVR